MREKSVLYLLLLCFSASAITTGCAAVPLYRRAPQAQTFPAEAFSRVRMIARDRRLIADPAQDAGGILTPALLIDGFTFTGQSEEA